ncbi:MAG TPA: hypothetical protein VMM78_11125 [Thermomicrobiales bacterium]|nr:hypothetical protein [Thermomicrobiales bacterium]
MSGVRGGRFLARPLYVGLVAAQWVALVLALASVNVHASGALRNYVTPSISDGYLLLAPFVLAGLLGATVSSARLLIALALAMCLVSAIILGAVIYAPAWLGITARAVSLQNYASQHALFVALWTVLPALFGCAAGHYLGGELRRAATSSRQQGPPAWWDRLHEGRDDA